MPDTLKTAAVQFEMAEDDKPANIKKMIGLLERAAAAGAELVCFPELCTTGYHYLTQLNPRRIGELGETLSDSPTLRTFAEASRRLNAAVAFGMLERDGEKAYNTYVVVSPEAGLVFRHRKVHAFENSAISCGRELEVFELRGWKIGVLICYDNNIPENARVLALRGAEMILAPHQTGGFDIPRAGMGRIDPELWRNRKQNPDALRREIMGPKGRAWITKWLPSRAYDNNVFYVFANGVGIDGVEVRTGNSMIVGPEGIILAESLAMDDDVIIATLDRRRREGSLPSIHMASRLPALYGPITREGEVRSTRELRNSISRETIV